MKVSSFGILQVCQYAGRGIVHAAGGKARSHEKSRQAQTMAAFFGTVTRPEMS
jgi:hypothetical protein